MGNLPLVIVSGFIGFVSCLIGAIVYYGNLKQMRSLLFAQIRSAEQTLMEDISQIAKEELEQTPSGRELLAIMAEAEARPIVDEIPRSKSQLSTFTPADFSATQKSKRRHKSRKDEPWLPSDESDSSSPQNPQIEYLRRLYQADIDRYENERAEIARVLHDSVLRELAVLATSAREKQPISEGVTTYQLIVQQLRQTIVKLRPAMLNYGLRSALEQLSTDLADKGINVQVNIGGSDVRYPPEIEQHLFRIVQQAGENAVQHAQANSLYVGGSLAPKEAELIVEDDGIGLPAKVQDDLKSLIEQKHFGLAGMYERAALIGASMHLNSLPGRGTQVRVTWKAK